MERSWQKAQNELSMAIWTIKYASDVPAGLLKNENVNAPQRLFNNRDQKQIDVTKSEFEQITSLMTAMKEYQRWVPIEKNMLL